MRIKHIRSFGLGVICLAVCFAGCAMAQEKTHSGNPLFEGWYADPEVAVFGDTYWIFPTLSDDFDKQTYFDAFSSKDLVTWTQHPHVLDQTKVTWLRRALWAPAVTEKDGKYYLFFSCNDPMSPVAKHWKPEMAGQNNYGGIGVAVADRPEGPYRDLLGKALISDFANGAQPIDQFFFRYQNSDYMTYGGWGHCNLVRLAPDFKSLISFDDGERVKEITPAGYVEGSVMVERRGVWYFMWSEGNWGDSTYRVAYAMAKTPFGPFKRLGVVLSQNPAIATGAGHHSVLNIPGTDDWYIVYHRRPIPNQSPHHRVTCIDRLFFNGDGTIQPVRMTVDGVERRLLEKKGH